MVFEIVFRLAAALGVIGGAMAACPNHCNAHEACDFFMNIYETALPQFLRVEAWLQASTRI